MLAAAGFAFASLLHLGFAQAATDDFGAVRAAADEALRTDAGGSLLNRPEMPSQVDRWWAALRRWTAARFDRLGPAAAESLAADVHRLDPQHEVRAVPLGGGAMLVAASRYGHGTAFILDAQGGRYRSRWTLSDVGRAPPPDPAFRSLANWAATATLGQCAAGPDCRILSAAEIGVLPRGANGAVRFYLRGTYFSEMGATKGAQLSLWEWDGAAARPLLVRDFVFMIDQDVPVLTVEGPMLTLRIKGDFRHFIACGGCEGRQMLWRFLAGPDGISDLGRESLVPEIDLIDEVADRLLRGADVTAVSDPAAADYLRRQIEAAPIGRNGAAVEIDFGMIGGWRVSGPSERRVLCLSADELGGRFTIARTARGLRLVAARALEDHGACSGEGSRM
jgi:hypothetical protein